MACRGPPGPPLASRTRVQVRRRAEPQVLTGPRSRPQRDAYIRRLNGIYASNFDREGVEYHLGRGRVLSPTSVEVTRPDGQTYVLSGEKITIAVGGQPSVPSEEQIPGAGLGHRLGRVLRAGDAARKGGRRGRGVHRRRASGDLQCARDGDAPARARRRDRAADVRPCPAEHASRRG